MSGAEKMNPRQRFPITLKLLVFLAVAFLVVLLGVRYAMRQRQEVALEDVRKNQRMPDEPDHVRLSTIPASSPNRNHLLDGDFKIVNRVRDVAEGCRYIFDSSFVNSSGSAQTTASTINLADPGQEFQTSDDVRPGLPFRRLVLAGLGHKTCFVYYEHGGAMYPSSCLAVMDYSQKRAIWVGESRKKAETVEELRSMLTTGQFADTAGPVC